MDQARGKYVILLVDDDAESTRQVARSLGRRNASLEFQTATDSHQALEVAKRFQPFVAVVDLSLNPTQGPESGLTLIRDLLEQDPTLRLLVLTGHGADEFGVRALQLGAASFLNKPADISHLLALIQDGIACAEIKRRVKQLAESSESNNPIPGLSSESPKMLQVLREAAYAATTKQPVLITGETGTGKGVLAQAIHDSATHRKGLFIRFQPSYNTHDLVSSELFGHEKGAFTGAVESRKGLLEEVDGGTLFIDEVAELPSETQVLLLDVLQERKFRRIGSNKEKTSDFRLISATNHSIENCLNDKKLREDFYHRIAHFVINIPPLRERMEDIPLLAKRFLGSLVNRENLGVQDLSADAFARLAGHNWPGNVRELEACVEGGVYRANFHKRRFVQPEDLTFQTKDSQISKTIGSFREQVANFELALIKDALHRFNGNQSKAAQFLNLDRTSLRRVLQRKV